MTSPMVLRQILVVGDGRTVREVAAAVAGSEVAVRGPFAPSVAQAAGIDPEVAVVDQRCPVGPDAIEQTIALFPDVRVLVAGADDDAGAGDAFGRGACGLFPVDRRHRADALWRAAAGEVVIPDGQLATILAGIGDRRIAADAEQLAGLTGREREVLRLIAEGVGTTEVARALGIAPATVQSHVKNLLAKLGVHSKVEAARVAWRVGIAGVPAGI
jgi:DNA-binding NarL/FixJ family response regulator